MVEYKTFVISMNNSPSSCQTMKVELFENPSFKVLLGIEGFLFSSRCGTTMNK